MRAERAKDLVRAFKALPVELSADMDAHKVALATRISFLRHDRGCRAAADELWAAIKARCRPELLSAAVAERLDYHDLDGDQATERAEELHLAANEACRAALSPIADEDVPDDGPLEVDHAPRGAAQPARRPGLARLTRLLRAGTALAHHQQRLRRPRD
jgi:hypothetical protein